MAKYVCGPDTVLRLEGRAEPVTEGQAFEFEFPPDQEAALLTCGAMQKADEPSPSRALQRGIVQPAGPAGDAQKE